MGSNKKPEEIPVDFDKKLSKPIVSANYIKKETINEDGSETDEFDFKN